MASMPTCSVSSTMAFLAFSAASVSTKSPIPQVWPSTVARYDVRSLVNASSKSAAARPPYNSNTACTRPFADEPIEALSLGQGRLVEVGRALMTEPSLLLLDEPSSGLDREETEALADTLRAIQAEKGFAILMVEHDVDLVADFTERLYVLDFGTLIAEGPTTNTLGDPAVRQAYLGTMEAG